MRRALLVLVALSGCADFDAIEIDACARRGVCPDGGGFAPDAGTDAGTADAGFDAGVAAPYCSGCTASAQCGPGNYCIPAQVGGSYCGSDCTVSMQCGPNQRCAVIRVAGNPVGSNCVPLANQLCDGGTVDGG